MMESQPQPFNTPGPDQAALMQRRFILNARARSGTDWFFWIAGLSIINSISSLAGASLSFVAGLGITQIVDGFASVLGEKGGDSSLVIHIIGLLINLAIASIFVVAGFLARKHYRWIVIAGMALYVLDALIFLFVKSWFGFLFHGWALWGLWSGLQALNALKKLDESV